MCETCETLTRLNKQKTILIKQLETENKRLREEIAALLGADAMLPDSITDVDEWDGRR